MTPREALESIDAVKRAVDANVEQQMAWKRAVTDDGHFFFMGRKVLLTFEDTGKPTHEDEQIRAFFGSR